MIDDLLLHQTTRHQLKALLDAQAQVILISGELGTGKHTLALSLAGELLKEQNLANYPYFLRISPDKQNIGIESVRSVTSFLQRKTTGKNAIRRIVLIDDAHTMSDEAQNAQLKTLEEPPTDTIIILTTNDITALKFTIRSRAQQLLVLPVNQELAAAHFIKHGYKNDEIQTAYFMSDGGAGLMTALLEQAKEHELVSAIEQAKVILRMTTYQRLLLVDASSKQKDETLRILQGLKRVVLSGLRQATAKNNETAVGRFYSLCKSINTAEEEISHNANNKLVLTKLFLSM